MKIAISIIFGLFVGLVIGFIAFTYLPNKAFPTLDTIPLFHKKQAIGFLPYWLLDKAEPDYSEYLTTLAYFGITVDDDGSILKKTNPQEAEPGWHALESGKTDSYLKNAKQKGMKLSLVAFMGDQEAIAHLVSDPVPHAKTFSSEVIPVMKRHGFTDLNIDIESVTVASDEARLHFTTFVKEVRREMKRQQAGSLSIDVIGVSLIKPYLTNVAELANLVDKVIVMTYDYHYQGSSVSGPVAPLRGAGTISEFDVDTAVRKAQAILPNDKIIVGLPVYGYEWETLRPNPRTATMPESGLTASNKRVQDLLVDCDNCVIKRESEADEPYISFFDKDSNTYHQIYYPDLIATTAKIKYVSQNNLGGVAVWALGYETAEDLKPLIQLK